MTEKSDGLQKEAFSEAYVRAVSAAAGFRCNRSYPDVLKDDLNVQAVNGRYDATDHPVLDLQLKASSVLVEKDGRFALQIEKRLHNECRNYRRAHPLFLILVRVPPDTAKWLEQSHDMACVRHCAYWLDLHGADAAQTESVTVHFPTTQIFDVNAIRKLMQKVGDGEFLPSRAKASGSK